MNPRLQAIIDRVRAIDLTARQRRILVWAGYPLFALVVALITFDTSIPSARIKDRLETALSADVSSGQPMAIGMDVEIGDLVTTLFTGVGFKASNIVLRSRPLNPSEKPARYVIDDVRVRLGLFSTLFGTPSYSFKAHALSGLIRGHEEGNDKGTEADFSVDKLVLTGAPGIQQAVGGLPIDGVVSGRLAITLPSNLLANSHGSIDLDIENAVIGDGKAKLTVPNDPFLSAGITFPRIRLGRLAGRIVIEKGRARFEGVQIHSPDADATLDGYVELRDPIGLSQMHAYLKFRPSDALVKREPTIELMTNTLATTARRTDGYFGLQITGPLSALAFLPARDPPYGVTTRSGPPLPPSPPPPPAAMAAPPAGTVMPPPPPPPNEPAGEPEPNEPEPAANEPANAGGMHGGSASEAARAAGENARIAGEAAHAIEGGPREVPPVATPPSGGATVGPPPARNLHVEPAERNEPPKPE